MIQHSVEVLVSGLSEFNKPRFVERMKGPWHSVAQTARGIVMTWNFGSEDAAASAIASLRDGTGYGRWDPKCIQEVHIVRSEITRTEIK